MASQSEDFDNETGEKRGVCLTIRRLPTNAETGEPELGESILRRKFQAPLKNLEPRQEKGSRKAKPRRKTIRGFYFRKEVGLNVVKEFVLCKRKQVSPMMFMLPTLFICPGWASILCLLGEACMHMWSHRRNRRKKNANIEYRSPLHLISSQFCVHCRSKKSMEKIGEIQDKRTLRRTVLYPNSRKKVLH